MATSKKKTTKKTKGFRVSFSIYWDSIGVWKRAVTEIVYNTQQEAQRYADQLNKGRNTKNARVRKA
jgi:hypothetical protein